MSVRENAQGEVLEGREFDVRLKPLVFSPKRRHGTCEWEGDRWVLTVFVSRNWRSFLIRRPKTSRTSGSPFLKETLLKPFLRNIMTRELSVPGQLNALETVVSPSLCHGPQ